MIERPASPATDREPKVLVCRGCCCGTADKHPDLDHDEQLSAIAEVARTRTIDCLDECLYSNVVVVRPTKGEAYWFGRLNSPLLTAELCEWLEAGAPLPLPPVLEVYEFQPKSRLRAD